MRILNGYETTHPSLTRTDHVEYAEAVLASIERLRAPRHFPPENHNRGGTMSIIPDGIQAAADREDEFHPTSLTGRPVSAWQRRAATIKALAAAANEHETRLAALEGKLANIPFPFNG